MVDPVRSPISPAASGTPWLRYAVDGLPAIAFLAVIVITHNFRLATMFVIGAAILALVISLIVERRVRTLPAITVGLAVVFGGASLLLNRPDILQMKMTIVDTALGAILFGGLLIKRNPLKFLLGGAFALSERAWTILAMRYGLFWWACAAANEFVRRTQTAETWGIFRVAVLIGAVVFALSQTPFLMKHGVAPSSPETPEPPDTGI